MKEYYDAFITEHYEKRISIRTEKGKIVLGIDIGCDGVYEDLNKKEAEKLISMLKEAIKKNNRRSDTYDNRY